MALLDKVRKEKRLPTLALACWNVCHGIPVIPAVCLTHALQLLCGSTRAAAHLATAPKHANETATKSSRLMLQPLRLPPAPEQEHFPRDKICGDAVCTPAIHILEASRSAGAASWEGRLRLADRKAVAAAAAARLRLCRSQDCSWCRRLPAQALLPHPGLLLMHALQTSFIGNFLFLQEMGVIEELKAADEVRCAVLCCAMLRCIGCHAITVLLCCMALRCIAVLLCAVLHWLPCRRVAMLHGSVHL